MLRITHSRIQKLAQTNTYPAVSIYVPLEGDYYDIRETALQLVRQARDRLLDYTSYDEARHLLNPAYEIIHDRTQWAHEAYENGSVLFLDKGNCNHFVFPEAERSSTYVGHGFVVSPLFEQLVQNGRFYTLSLTSRLAELYLNDVVGTHKLMRERIATPINSKNGHRNYYSRREADTSSMTKRQLNRIVKEVRKRIEDKTAPLILVGLPKAQASYRKVSDYDLLMPDGVNLNPNSLSPKEMADRARPMAQQFYKYYEKAAHEEFAQRFASDQAHVVSGIRAVLEALSQRKVRTLFINPKDALWGEPVSNAVHARRQRGDVNLTNLAVRRALASDTEIFHLPSNAAPATSAVAAAILKY